MKDKDCWTSIILAVIGFYVAYEGYQLNLGTPNNPKAGFMIFWTGMILGVLSILLFMQTVFSPAQGKKELWKGLEWPRGLKLMLSLVIYAAVFKWLGFILSTFLLLLFMFKGLEPQKWRIALSLSAATVALCYLIFNIFLELQFPQGVLKFISN